MKTPSFYNKFFIAIGVSGFILAAGLIVSLLIFYSNAKKNLVDAARNLEALGNSYIECMVPVDTVIQVDTEIKIIGAVPIDISLLIADSMPLVMPLNLDSFSIPVSIDLDTVLHVDTSLVLPDTLSLMVTGAIPVDQKFTAYKKFKIPIKATIPLMQLLNAKADSATTFISDIPIRLKINKNVPVKLNIIKVNQKIKIDLSVNEPATASFPEKLKIEALIPLHLMIPVKIQLSKTPLKEYLRKTATDIENVFTL